MRKLVLSGAALISIALSPAAPQAPQPFYSVGDEWVYIGQNEGPRGELPLHPSWRIERVQSSGLLVAIRPAGSDMRPRRLFWGLDLSQRRSVDGVETVVNRPLAFPLSVGKSWQLDNHEERPPRSSVVHEHQRITYRVTEHRPVATRAGTFDAFKVEAEGNWEGDVAPAISSTTTVQGGGGGTEANISTATAPVGRHVEGRIYKEFWYAPAVRSYVKVVEEMYNPENVRITRESLELESFKPASASSSN